MPRKLCHYWPFLIKGPCNYYNESMSSKEWLLIQYAKDVALMKKSMIMFCFPVNMLKAYEESQMLRNVQWIFCNAATGKFEGRNTLEESQCCALQLVWI